MCTAITFKASGHYFGRNLDLEYNYGENVVITPRNFRLSLRSGGELCHHYAMIGTAAVSVGEGESIRDGYPLYYDATNEVGLSMAGLNFVGNARFYPRRDDRINLAQFEIIPYILGRCKSVLEVREEIGRINLVGTPFSRDFPPSELHYIIADKDECIVVEPMADGVKIYENSVGVLTNNPPFPYQLENLKMYLNLTPTEAHNRFSPELELASVSRGMGAFGLPGDVSSPSRFVRAAFVRANSIKPQSEELSVGQFFHILGSVEQVEGTVKLKRGLERTQYSSCCNTDTGVYYYKTYENSRITAVGLHSADLDGDRLSVFPFIIREDIKYQSTQPFEFCVSN